MPLHRGLTERCVAAGVDWCKAGGEDRGVLGTKGRGLVCGIGLQAQQSAATCGGLQEGRPTALLLHGAKAGAARRGVIGALPQVHEAAKKATAAIAAVLPRGVPCAADSSRSSGGADHFLDHCLSC